MEPCWSWRRPTRLTARRIIRPYCCSAAPPTPTRTSSTILKDLKQAYGIIKPRTANITVEGAEVTAVRCDIQTYYAVLATITYDSGDVVYVSALTKLASINDIVNLVESVSLS